MINLLPPGLKRAYRFARRNVTLRRWIFANIVAFIGLVVIGASGYFYLGQISKSYDNQISTTTESLAKQNLAQTQKEAKEINSNLKLAVEVLSKQVLFSKLLEQLGTLVPNNATLSDFEINQADSAIDITARTADYNAATQLQVNMADPANKIFDKADIVSISCAEGTNANSPQASKYPCTVTIRALFTKENPYLFINDRSAS